MEGSGKKMRAICVILVIMLGMFARESEAFNRKCYDKCMVRCLFKPFSKPGVCVGKCGRKCIFKSQGSSASGSTSLSLNDELHNQCIFGCAKTNCANITTSMENTRGDDVEGCVNNCSNACIKEH